MSKFKVVDQIWFIPRLSKQCIGIVIAEERFSKERRTYIGIGDSRDEEEDIKHILNTGISLTREVTEWLVEILNEFS